GRPRVRFDLSRTDRRDPQPATHRPARRRQPDAAVRVHAVRGVLRRLPGADRHPGGAGPPAPDRSQAGAGAGRDGVRVVGDAGSAALPVGAAGAAVGGRAPAAGEPARAGTARFGPAPALAAVAVDFEPGRAGAARGLLSPVVGEPMSARAEILARLRA